MTRNILMALTVACLLMTLPDFVQAQYSTCGECSLCGDGHEYWQSPWQEDRGNDNHDCGNLRDCDKHPSGGGCPIIERPDIGADMVAFRQDMEKLRTHHLLDGRDLAEIASRWDEVVVFNRKRTALQILDCDGSGMIVGHLKLSGSQLSAVEKVFHGD